jgi:hypothetical protein
VTSCLKVGIVEPEEMSIAKQRLGKHIPVEMNVHATIPFLSNGSVNMCLQQQGYCSGRCFLFGPYRVVIRETVGAIQLVSAECS